MSPLGPRMRFQGHECTSWLHCFRLPLSLPSINLSSIHPPTQMVRIHGVSCAQRGATLTMKASDKCVCADDTQTFTKSPGTLPAHPIQHWLLLLLTGSRRGPHLPLPSASGGGPVILSVSWTQTFQVILGPPSLSLNPDQLQVSSPRSKHRPPASNQPCLLASHLTYKPVVFKLRTKEPLKLWASRASAPPASTKSSSSSIWLVITSRNTSFRERILLS